MKMTVSRAGSTHWPLFRKPASTGSELAEWNRDVSKRTYVTCLYPIQRNSTWGGPNFTLFLIEWSHIIIHWHDQQQHCYGLAIYIKQSSAAFCRRLITKPASICFYSWGRVYMRFWVVSLTTSETRWFQPADCRPQGSCLTRCLSMEDSPIASPQFNLRRPSSPPNPTRCSWTYNGQIDQLFIFRIMILYRAVNVTKITSRFPL